MRGLVNSRQTYKVLILFGFMGIMIGKTKMCKIEYLACGGMS